MGFFCQNDKLKLQLQSIQAFSASEAKEYFMFLLSFLFVL